MPFCPLMPFQKIGMSLSFGYVERSLFSLSLSSDVSFFPMRILRLLPGKGGKKNNFFLSLRLFTRRMNCNL